MIWRECYLQAKVKIEKKDALGNELYEWRTVAETKARHTPWTDEQVSLDGRNVTKNEQRYVLMMPYSELPPCQRAVIGGRVPADITGVTELGERYTLIQVKVYKERPNGNFYDYAE